MKEKYSVTIVEEVVFNDSPLSVGNDVVFNSCDRPDYYVSEFKRLKVEGADELAILCPVSKLTGFPMSMQAALLMITDSNARIADMLFQPLNEVRTSDLVSDDDKFKMLVSRLDTGSFFENERAAEILGDIAKEFFPEAEVERVVSEAQSKINFESTEVPSADA